MEIGQIVAIGLISVILGLILSKQNPEWSMYIRIAAGIIIFAVIIDRLGIVLEIVKRMSEKIDIDIIYIEIVFKVLGIAYISEFGAQLCKDAGESSIASKIEFAGKVLIITVSAPVMLALMDIITRIIP
ncbi:MAG: stage sporulation protein [Epulopiscium sp.]|jgi:stage III sporulation protein AD|uniref:Stage III sporulation protein AD n=1 Tax=Defluviitalea raffinosedens TaxID=1450156 RepID=A0A7C8HHR8_9FIRM|nr:stage III sporulation protein AD [Defluviitalea raffinosedens]KAE9637233.1 stage III sporulation protein AD [Defluviitalea raffinosedens]MBM7685534.1 stage III sporulation protein AD [Defluviitalea raffinosedens]MBZ4668534.1 stage sporulation protein [Defluviitaleaceae bacterium]MDK2788700.1 stage sporulation protein [Candidatus Epulonipiscium sp.]